MTFSGENAQGRSASSLSLPAFGEGGRAKPLAAKRGRVGFADPKRALGVSLPARLRCFSQCLRCRTGAPDIPFGSRFDPDLALRPIEVEAVLAAVRLHDQPPATAFEIGDVTPDRRLSAEMESKRPKFAQPHPQLDLLAGHGPVRGRARPSCAKAPMTPPDLATPQAAPLGHPPRRRGGIRATLLLMSHQCGLQ